jgi:type IV pilus assembly protein PilC
MPVWTYSARTVAGDIRRAEVDLPSKDHVIAYLRRQKLIPVSVREKPKDISFSAFRRVKSRDIVIFTRQFSTMINAGLPLVQALDILARQTEQPVLQKAVQDVLYDVESGHTLADAMKEHEKVFSNLYTNMVAAGESGGILDTILLRLATFLEKNEALARKVKGAMVYPAVVLGVAVLAIAILLLFVIPTFEAMFASFNQQLPLPTRLVIWMSQFLQGFWWALLGMMGVAAVMFRRWVGTATGRLRFDRFILKVPIIGPLSRKAAIARFTRTLGTMLSSGVSILDGLEITARTAGNRVIHDAVMESRSSIAGGKSISEPLKDTGVFPPMVTQMIHVGEETGDLDGMLSKIADFYDDEVDVAVGNLLKVLEPLLIVVLGTIVGGMIVAMYLPIFSLVNAIQ